MSFFSLLRTTSEKSANQLLCGVNDTVERIVAFGAVVGDEGGYDLAVAGGVEVQSPGGEKRLDLAGVGDVAVVDRGNPAVRNSVMKGWTLAAVLLPVVE